MLVLSFKGNSHSAKLIRLFSMIGFPYNIELKASQKNSSPIFPVHIRKFSLQNLGHSKVEAEALEEVKLVNIEHKTLVHTTKFATVVR
jgi:hypothetical protein